MRTVTNRRGKRVTLLNPAEKGRKAAAELQMGIKITNDGVVKTDKRGDPIALTDKERAWRSGYLSARQDNAKCYNAQQKKAAKQAAKAQKRAAKASKRTGKNSRTVVPLDGDFYL